MSLQGVAEERLNLKSYQTIMNRLKMEEACLAGGGSGASGLATSQNTSGISGGNSAISSSSGIASGNTTTQLNQDQPTTAASSMGSIFSSSMLSSFAGYGSSTGSNSSSAAAGNQQSTNSGLAGQHQSTIGSSYTTSGSNAYQPGINRNQYHQQSFGPGGSNNPNFPRGRPPVDLSMIGQQQPDPNAINQNEQQENLADRALQSATRMFKGFWS